MLSYLKMTDFKIF